MYVLGWQWVKKRGGVLDKPIPYQSGLDSLPSFLYL
jgi:hypothetical protein